MNILQIDRSTPFDPVAFLGDGWSIVEQDERSLALTEVDLSKINFETTLKDGERSVVGWEKFKRLKNAGYIRLDAKVFQTLLENQHLIPESWKEEFKLMEGFSMADVFRIYFDGTVLRDPSGDRYVIYMYWDDGRWNTRLAWFGDEWSDITPSAVLAK
jgi:hypothetical protein